jgi:hypothetical protein
MKNVLPDTNRSILHSKESLLIYKAHMRLVDILLKIGLISATIWQNVEYKLWIRKTFRR